MGLFKTLLGAFERADDTGVHRHIRAAIALLNDATKPAFPGHHWVAFGRIDTPEADLRLVGWYEAQNEGHEKNSEISAEEFERLRQCFYVAGLGSGQPGDPITDMRLHSHSVSSTDKARPRIDHVDIRVLRRGAPALKAILGMNLKGAKARLRA